MVSCSTCEAGCLSWSPSCAGITSNRALIPSEQCLGSRIDKVASKNFLHKGKKGKSILLPKSFMWAAARRCGPDLAWVFSTAEANGSGLGGAIFCGGDPQSLLSGSLLHSEIDWNFLGPKIQPDSNYS